MLVAFKEPNEPAYLTEISGSMIEFRDMCEGKIQVIYAQDDMAILINMEGEMLGLEPNIPVDDNGFMEIIFGNIVIVSTKPHDGEFHSLNDEQIKILKANDYFGEEN